jgi:DNA-binding transcriptional MerR regulator
MFKIGEFAALSRVSVRMLRHYDKIGLLRPAHTDPETGYRYYTSDQLHDLQRLHSLRELGLSLEQVQQVWEHALDHSGVTFEAILRLKQAESRRHLRETLARLERIDQQLTRLRQSHDAHLTHYNITVTSLPAVVALTCRAIMPPLSPEEVFVLREAARHALTSAGIKIQSAFMLLHNPSTLHHRAHDEAWPLDFEIAFTVAEAASLSPIPLLRGHVLSKRDIPGHATVATALHQGAARGLSEAHAAVAAWITANGGVADCPIREVYVQQSFTDVGTNVIEVQYPFRKVPVTPTRLANNR